MLICFSSTSILRALCDAIEIRMTSIVAVHPYKIGGYEDEFMCYVFSPEGSKKDQILGCIDVTHANRVIVIDESYPLDQIPNDFTFVVTSTDDLEELMCTTFTPAARNKISSRIFGEQETTHIAIRMLPMILGIIRGAPPQEQPKRVKRSRTAECVACQSETSCIMFNCGHECMCDSCATAWLAEKKQCPLCRLVVDKIFY